MKIIFKKIRNQTGQAFILVLILLAVGGMILAPLLTYMNSGLNAEEIYASKVKDFHAADSGVEDALWQIKYDHLDEKFTSPAYDKYNYDIFGASYAYPESLNVNDRDVSVSISNVWVPLIDPDPVEEGLSRTDMRNIIEAGNIIVSGTVIGPGEYKIKMSYTPDFLSGEELRVTKIGVWLPPGFTYVEGSSNLEEDEDAFWYPSDVEIVPHAGGQAVIWHYDFPGPRFALGELPGILPGVSPRVAEITFNYLPNDREPEAVAWMKVSEGSVGDDLPPFAWDADINVYKIDSSAGSVDIEAYAIKSELRQLQSSIAGDYRAIGNSLMARSSPSIRYRDILLADSSTTIDDITNDAEVVAAYLYWSAWLEGQLDLDKIGDAIWQDDCSEYGILTSIWQDDCSSLGTWNSIWQENCSSYDDGPYTWNDGNNWTIYNNDEFQGQGGGTAADRTVTLAGSIDLSASSGQTANISWDQCETAYLWSSEGLYFALSGDGGASWSSNEVAFLDDIGSTPQSFSYTIPDTYLTADFRVRFYLQVNDSWDEVYIDNIEIEALASSVWAAGANWTVVSGEFRGQGGGTTADRTITRIEDIDLSAYTGQMVILSWDQYEYGYLESDDYLYFALSGDGGASWSGNIEAFNDDNPSSTFNYAIPDEYLTSQFRIRYLWDADSTSEYCYIDNIDIGTFSGDWLPGSNWTIYNNDEFRGQGGGTTTNRTLTRVTDIDLGAYTGQNVAIFWEQREYGDLESDDYLYFALSGDGGASWSGNIEAFNNDNPSSTFNYAIPDEYLTSQFRIRYLWDADSTSEYCYIDNIEIYECSGEAYADNTAYFKIDGQRVYFDGDGLPQIDYSDTETITADVVQWIDNTDYGNPHGYSYSCKADVTDLVRTFSAEGIDENYPGNGVYTVGDVEATWDSSDEWAYAGWSLIIIYYSPETEGRQIYLYDSFLYKDHNDEFLDFDQDGTQGGTISDFIVPEQISGEVIVAKMTCFAGEGDIWYEGDYLEFNGAKLPDDDDDEGLGGTNTDNVWNGESIGMSAEGVDVDTFYVRWDDYLLSPGDTSAQIDIWTEIDIWNLVYIVLAFRSETTISGTVTYLIY